MLDFVEALGSNFEPSDAELTLAAATVRTQTRLCEALENNGCLDFELEVARAKEIDERLVSVVHETARELATAFPHRFSNDKLVDLFVQLGRPQEAAQALSPQASFELRLAVLDRMVGALPDKRSQFMRLLVHAWLSEVLARRLTREGGGQKQRIPASSHAIVRGGCGVPASSHAMVRGGCGGRARLFRPEMLESTAADVGFGEVKVAHFVAVLERGSSSGRLDAADTSLVRQAASMLNRKDVLEHVLAAVDDNAEPKNTKRGAQCVDRDKETSSTTHKRVR